MWIDDWIPNIIFDYNFFAVLKKIFIPWFYIATGEGQCSFFMTRYLYACTLQHPRKSSKCQECTYTISFSLRYTSDFGGPEEGISRERFQSSKVINQW